MAALPFTSVSPKGLVHFNDKWHSGLYAFHFFNVLDGLVLLDQL